MPSWRSTRSSRCVSRRLRGLRRARSITRPTARSAALLAADPAADPAALRSLRRSAADLARVSALARSARAAADAAPRRPRARDRRLRRRAARDRPRAQIRRPPLAGAAARGADARRGATSSMAPSARPGAAPSRRAAGERGFNQAADLARHLGLPVVPALRRVRATADPDRPARGAAAPQRPRRVRATRAARGCRVRSSSDRRRQHHRRDARGLRAGLKEAGVGEVRALTAARVVTRRPR